MFVYLNFVGRFGFITLCKSGTSILILGLRGLYYDGFALKCTAMSSNAPICVAESDVIYLKMRL